MEPTSFRVIIAGSRGISDIGIVNDAIKASNYTIDEVVSGCAIGVDMLGEMWAYFEGIPIAQFRPDWSLGKHAGFLRNEEMAKYADKLIAVWDGKSKGTAHMIKTMEALGKPVFVYKTTERKK